MSDLLPHQQRVVREEVELSEKIAKLAAFLDGDSFERLDPAEQGRLARQNCHMKAYRDILRERMEAFGATPGIKTASGEPFTPTT